MATLRQKTLKHWANTTNYLCSQNTDGKTAKEEYRDLIRENYPGYVELPFWKESFRDEKESMNCDKLIVYAWYWWGNWSDPTKEVYARLYKPKQRP